MEQCIFCQIATGQIPTNFIYQDENIVALPDIHPKAPTHILIIPKKHIPSIEELSTEDDYDLVSNMIKVAQQIAREQNINTQGYRLVFNIRSHGGQEVPHLHLHLIGGHQLGSMT